MKKSINIFIPTELINNFEILGDMTLLDIKGEDIQVNIFKNSVKGKIEDNKVFCNMDLAITCSMIGASSFSNELTAKAFLPENKLLHLPRFSKPEQMVKILHHLSMMKNNDNFIVPSVFYQSSKGTHFNRFAVEQYVNSCDLVIKPIHGARGIGQLVIKKERNVSINKVIQLITNSNNSSELMQRIIDFNQEHGEVVSYSPEKSVNDGSKTINDTKLKTGDDSDVTEITKTDINGDEGLQALLKQGFYIQEVIEQIESEFRMITDFKGNIVYCQRRNIEIRSDGFPQACGSDGKENDGHDLINLMPIIEHHFTTHELKILKSIAKNVIGPFNSFDVFKTMAGEFGIFEYCNQFGIEGIPKTIAWNLHVNLLKDFIISSNILNEE